MKTCDVTLDREYHESKAGYSASKDCIEDNCGDQTPTDMYLILQIYRFFDSDGDGSNCQLQGV